MGWYPVIWRSYMRNVAGKNLNVYYVFCMYCIYNIYTSQSQMHIHNCTHIYIYIYINVCICKYIYMHMYKYIFTYTYTHTHIYIYVKHICLHVRLQNWCKGTFEGNPDQLNFELFQNSRFTGSNLVTTLNK